MQNNRDPRSDQPGDQPDLGGVYQRLRKSLMRYASRYLKKPQEIEDIVQEAFVRVLEAQSTRKIHATDSYLYRTTRNLAFNALDKSDHKLTDTVGDLLPQSVLLESPTLEDEFESRERFELFCRAVRELPVKCQRVFILRRVYGLSQKEIAERMGISVKTVEAHLSKAIVRCTDFMDAGHDNAGAHAGTRAGAHNGIHNGTHAGTHSGTHSGTHTGTHAGTQSRQAASGPLGNARPHHSTKRG